MSATQNSRRWILIPGAAGTGINRFRCSDCGRVATDKADLARCPKGCEKVKKKEIKK